MSILRFYILAMIVCTLLVDIEFDMFAPVVLPQQALMEHLISGLSDSKEFKDANDNMLDIHDWRGVTCNSEGDVEMIEWDEIEEGDIDTRWVPSTVRILSIVQSEVCGSIDFLVLPEGLVELLIECTCFSDAVDLRNIRSSIRSIELESNDFSGSVHLSGLANTLEVLSLSGNAFTGTVDLGALPESMVSLNLGRNELTGVVDLRHLPSNLGALFLRHNAFHGSIDLDSLPASLHTLYLSHNKLEGEVNLESFPESLTSLCLDHNKLSGSFDMSLVQHIPHVAFDGNDFDGVPSNNAEEDRQVVRGEATEEKCVIS